MKRLFTLLLFVFFAVWAFAQTDGLLSFNQTRLDQQKTSMMVLGGWAVGNIALGLALMNRYDDDRKYFHQMNAGWNAVNLGIAAFAYYSILKTDAASLDLYQSVKGHFQIQKILLLNAGLDVGYILGGLYLTERAKTNANRPDRLKGFGNSIMLQGAFLLVFDLTTYFIQASHNSKLEPWLSSLYFDGTQLGLVWQF